MESATQGRKDHRRRRLRWALLVLAWVAPLAFLGAGHWPFGLLIAILVTLWVVLDARSC